MNEFPRVCSLESRRKDEIDSLIRKFGGSPFVAPSMQERPIEDNNDAIAIGSKLISDDIDVLVFLTGVGATALLDAMATQHDRDELIAAIDRRTICLRGPKPAAVLRTWGVHIDVRAPEPNTWEDLVTAIDDSHLNLNGKRTVIQEYGEPNEPLAAALSSRGAIVQSAMVYKWALPDDTGPLENAVRGVSDGKFDIFMITSAQQIRHALMIAERLQLVDQFRSGLADLRVASIGPTATATLRSLDIRVDCEPKSPKMGPLVREALVNAPQQKRR